MYGEVPGPGSDAAGTDSGGGERNVTRVRVTSRYAVLAGAGPHGIAHNHVMQAVTGRCPGLAGLVVELLALGWTAS